MLETIFNKLPGSIYSSLEEINITSGEVLPSNSISTEFNNITKITFPNELKKIEEYSITFSGERLVLPDEVLTVESYAICGTEALKTISFGSKVSLIKEAFVHNTTKLENIYVNENIVLILNRLSTNEDIRKKYKLDKYLNQLKYKTFIKGKYDTFYCHITRAESSTCPAPVTKEYQNMKE